MKTKDRNRVILNQNFNNSTENKNQSWLKEIPYFIWRGVRSGLNLTATRGKNSDGHKKGGIQCLDGSTCCHTSYWHDALACLTFRHPRLKLFQLMPRFRPYFGQFSLPLFWVTFCILWLCDENTLNILVPGVSICRNLYEQSKNLHVTCPAKI